MLNYSTFQIGLVGYLIIHIDNVEFHALKHVRFSKYVPCVSLSIEINYLAEFHSLWLLHHIPTFVFKDKLFLPLTSFFNFTLLIF